ncbi:hypothetical protein IJ531_02400, partial [bacterium]|nr:hypothetical protein [bacterium]
AIINFFKPKEQEDIPAPEPQAPPQEQPVDTKDGKIGETNQRSTGDCWLLSGVNALSYTEAGRQAIKEALDYQPNGDTIVHLKGVGDYTITNAELEQIKAQQESGNGKYSTGDDDMLILELAVEKVFEDMAKRNFIFSQDAPSEYESSYALNGDLNTNGTTINGGSSTELMYLLTGKKTEFLKTKDDMRKALDEFDGKNTALGASIGSVSPAIKDINGQTITLPGNHAYAIKNVEGDKVTIVNPWDSSKEIVISKETFLETFSGMSKCDMSNKNQNVNYIKYPDEVDKDGNKIYYSDTYDFVSYSNLFSEQIKPAKECMVYDKDGTPKENALIDENGNKLTSSIWAKDKEGKLYEKERAAYFQDGSKGFSIVFNEDGQVDHYELTQFRNDGSWSQKVFINDKSTKDAIKNRNLLSYSQFAVDEIDILAHLSEKQWEYAGEYLENNPDAAIRDVLNYVSQKMSK